MHISNTQHESPWSSRAVMAVLAVAAGVLAPLLTPDAVAGVDAAAPVLTATPDTGLVDGQVIDIAGTGFTMGNPAAPGTAHAEIFECRSDAVDISGCDPDNGFDIDVRTDGTLDFRFRVDASIYPATGNFDCRSGVQACKIGVGLLGDLANSVFVPIDFDPAAPISPPVTATVDPSTGLVDGQSVAVHGAGLFPLFDTLIVQCGQAAGVPAGCDLDNAIRGNPPAADGTIDVTYPVRTQFRAGTGEEYDCVAAAEPCVMLVSVGATESPDRLATVPLEFASPVGPRPPSETPPAASSPVSAAPSFTG